MLETIRDCARDMLAASGRGTRERHARWVLRQVAELAPRLNTAAEEAALGRLGALLPEIRAATEHLSQADADAAADILVRTRRVWFVQGLMGEIRRAARPGGTSGHGVPDEGGGDGAAGDLRQDRGQPAGAVTARTGPARAAGNRRDRRNADQYPLPPRCAGKRSR